MWLVDKQIPPIDPWKGIALFPPIESVLLKKFASPRYACGIYIYQIIYVALLTGRN